MTDTSQSNLPAVVTSESSESELSDEHEENANLSSDCLSFGETASSIHDELPALVENTEKSNFEYTLFQNVLVVSDFVLNCSCGRSNYSRTPSRSS